MATDPRSDIEKAEIEQKKKSNVGSKITSNLSIKQIIGFLLVFCTIYWAAYIKTPPIQRNTAIFLTVLTLIIGYLLINKNTEDDEFDLPAAKRIVKKEALEMQEKGELPIGRIILMPEGTPQIYKTPEGYNPSSYYVAVKTMTHNLKEHVFVFRVNIKMRRITGIDRQELGWTTSDVRDYHILPGPAMREQQFEDRYLKTRRR